jgi:hypothetical protein
MSTPEGKVKDLVKKALKKFPEVYSWWPVPSGYGESALDCVYCVNGHFGMIETKAPGKKMTARQEECARRVRAAGGVVFEIDGKPEQIRELEAYLTMMSYPTR